MNLTDDALRAMTSKIEALFRKAADPAATEPEREIFHAKAVSLMTKHRIESIEMDKDETPGDSLYGWVKGSYAGAYHQIVSAIAKAYSCETWSWSSGRAGDPARRVMLFGFPADTARVKQLAALFIEDARLRSLEIKTHDPNTTIRRRKSFVFGYASAVGQRFREASDLLARESNTDTVGAGLVLVERDKQVALAFAQAHDFGHRSGRTVSLEGASYEAGKRAGRESNIGRDRIGGSGRALSQ